jgi:hypothetical protein
MDDKAYRATAQAVRLVALEARREAAGLDEHRAALARNALVWWQGGAAERYRQLVQERVNDLAVVSQHLAGLACRAEGFATVVERVADAAAAESAAGLRGR